MLIHAMPMAPKIRRLYHHLSDIFQRTYRFPNWTFLFSHIFHFNTIMYKNLGYNIQKNVSETSLEVLLISLWNYLTVFHLKIENCLEKKIIKRHKLQHICLNGFLEREIYLKLVISVFSF